MHYKKITSRLLVADLVWMLLAFLAAGSLRYGPQWISGARSQFHALLPFVLVGMASWVVLFRRLNLDGFRGGGSSGAAISRLLLGLLCLMGSLLAIGYLAREYVSRLVLAYFGAFLLIGLLVLRHALSQWLQARRRMGDVSRLVVVGSGTVARELAIKIEQHPEMLCEIVGFLSPDGAPHESGSIRLTGDNGIRRVSTLGIADFLTARNVNELIIALSQPTSTEIHTLARRCREVGIRVSLIPQPYELYLCQPVLQDLDGLPLLQMEEVAPSALFLGCKRFVDLALGTILFVLAIPIVLPAAIALRTIKGNAFRWDVRCGRHGNRFSLLRLNVPRQTSLATPFEQLLEDLSITELPQLWNVLRGQMSLVGPRPESPHRAQRYTDWQQRRLSVRPGITGLAQVHGLRDYNSSEDKTRYDLQYLLHPSLMIDFVLLLQTLWILGGRAARFTPHGRRVEESGRTEPILQEVDSVAYRSQSSAD